MKPYLFAILAGTHQHRWKNGVCETCGQTHSPHNFSSGTGVCSICGFSCAHPQGFEYRTEAFHRCPVCRHSELHNPSSVVATHDACCHCGVCDHDITTHHFGSDGICQFCGYVCNHAGTLVAYGTTQHRCTFCQWVGPHDFNVVASPLVCKHCSSCGYDLEHKFTGNHCDACGFTCDHTAYEWKHGICLICGMRVCQHEFDPADLTGGAVYCTLCGSLLRRQGDPFFCTEGEYMGSYYHTSGNEVNGQKIYIRYREHKYINDNGVLVDVGMIGYQYGMVALNITTPTRFGGDYMYTCRGLVFSDDPKNLPINNTLLSGNGKYIVAMRQYNLDGTPRSDEVSYTSPDFPALYGVDRDALISM